MPEPGKLRSFFIDDLLADVIATPHQPNSTGKYWARQQKKVWST